MLYKESGVLMVADRNGHRIWTASSERTAMRAADTEERTWLTGSPF